MNALKIDSYSGVSIWIIACHILLILSGFYLSYNISRNSESIFMTAQIISRESFSLTQSDARRSAKNESAKQDMAMKDNILNMEHAIDSKQDGVLAAAAVSMPNSEASELNNPKPPYPAISRKLREQGLVLLRACIGADGSLESLNIKRGSGYSRLDQAALQTIKHWRFIPAKKGSAPISMCYELPVKFILE